MGAYGWVVRNLEICWTIVRVCMLSWRCMWAKRLGHR
jgi:hypothetical protein